MVIVLQTELMCNILYISDPTIKLKQFIMDAKTENVLLILNLDKLIPSFQKLEINFETLYNLDDYDFSQVVPDIVCRTKLKKYIKNEKENEQYSTEASSENNLNSATHSSSVVSDSFISLPDTEFVQLVGTDFQQFLEDSNAEAEEPPSKKIKLKPEVGDRIRVENFFVNNYSLNDFLMQSSKGQNILRAYNTNKLLDVVDRRKLVHLIVDGLLERHETVTGEMFRELTLRIVEIFPNETAECYFSNQKPAKKNTCGKLIDRYRNEKKYIRKVKKSEAESNNNYNLTQLISDKTKEQIVWLKHNYQPWSKVVEYWKETFSAREIEYSQTGPINDVIENWPSLRHNLGHTLVSNIK